MRNRILALGILISALAAVAGAQPVLLQIKPHAGDTLSVRVEQRIEITGGRKDATRSMTTVTQVFSHAAVNRTTARDAEVTALTDSILTATFAGGKTPPLKRAPASEGSMRLRFSTDGGAELIEGSSVMAAAFGPMPATLSGKPVSIGDKWDREMVIPIAGEAGAKGHVRATFQLDSLGRNRDIAYISMKGKLSHDHTDGSISELDGSMTGSIQLNRRLGWITDTRASIDVNSTMRAQDGEPMHIHTRVTQMLKAAPAR